ncbi:hypothetical protein D3C84_863510 [compost metagenome]
MIQGAVQFLRLQGEVGRAGIPLDGDIEQAVDGVESLDPFGILEGEAGERGDDQLGGGVFLGSGLPGGDGGRFYGGVSGGGKAQAGHGQSNQSLLHYDISYISSGWY